MDERHQLGVVLRSFNEIVAANHPDARAAAAYPLSRARRKLNNRAVFEIPDLLQTLIAAAADRSRPAAAFRALA